MKLHPIIYDYVNTDDHLAVILERHQNKDIYLEKVFLELVKSTHEETFNEKLLLDLDQAVVKGHPDANIYFFFIAFAMVFTHRHNQYEKEKSLHSIISSSLKETLHPVIKTVCAQAKSQFMLIDGYSEENNRLMVGALGQIDKKNPRYKTLMINFTILLAINGLLNDLPKEDLKILNSITNPIDKFRVLEIKLMNCAMVGNHLDGFSLLDELRKNFPEKSTKNIKTCEDSLKMIAGDLDVENYKTEPHATLVQTVNIFLFGNTEDAFNNYQKLKPSILKMGRPLLVEYLLLHIEFGRGNKGMVRLLLKEKKDKGNFHYMDNLFYGRLHLLDKNYVAADQAFNSLMENVARYGSMNRLVYELQFAKEMRLPDILLLTQGWKKSNSPSVSQSLPTIIVKQNLIYKGNALLVGQSILINQVKELVKKFAPLKAPVLVTGETGTGKELVSRAIHDEGPYPEEPFLAINCGALTESLLQSELFGYVAGAFTGAQKEHKGIFEAAGKGTVFLDEFGDISPQLQVSLLRVLESNEIRMIGSTKTQKIDCRIVVATNVDLQQVVQEKKFREDLFYRLTKFEIRLPALRERIEDLPNLIHYFFESSNEDSKNPKTISHELLLALSAYHWPGNIRELKNEIDRLSILHAEKSIIELPDFDFTHLQAWTDQTIKKIDNSIKVNSIQQNTKPGEFPHSDDPYFKIIQQRSPQFDKRQALLKEVFQKYKKLTRNQVMGITNASPSTATKDLQLLCETGFIVRRSPTNSSRTYYFELIES